VGQDSELAGSQKSATHANWSAAHANWSTSPH